MPPPAGVDELPLSLPLSPPAESPSSLGGVLSVPSEGSVAVVPLEVESEGVLVVGGWLTVASGTELEGTSLEDSEPFIVVVLSGEVPFL